MSDMKIVGMQALKKKLKKNVRMDAVKKVIRHNGSQLQDKAQRNADFKGHYEWVKGKGKVFKKPTGATKEGIRLRPYGQLPDSRGGPHHGICALLGIWHPVHGCPTLPEARVR